MLNIRPPRINRKFLAIDLTRALAISGIMVVYGLFLSIDCYQKGVPSIAQLALFNAVANAGVMLVLFLGKKAGPSMGRRMRLFVDLAVFFLCCVYWNTFAVFLYTGSMEGTSIFLLFIAAPIGFYFFNLTFGLIFCLGLFAGMTIYMWTPLHLQGYAFPEMYYARLPFMYLVEVVICALAQFETAKAQSRQEQALIEAEQANQAKTDFLSNMSHEIRTPINAVLGMNEMIMRESIQARDNLPEERDKIHSMFADVTKYSHNIESAGNNLLSLINDILDFSKIEAGKLEIVEADYKLSSVLNDVCNMIIYKTRDKDLRFTADVDETLPDGLCGDEVRVRQVITNILNNAVKYTREGSVYLSVRGEKREPWEDSRTVRLVILVRDTGIGIKEEDISKLFSKFQRVDLRQNSTVEGTGLGLAITHNLLSKMGGSIDVKSVYGEGSTFIIRLPQKIVSDEPVGDFRTRLEKSQDRAPAYEESFRAEDARILVVDDTRMNLMVVAGLLKNTGLQIDTAGSGEESIRLAGKTKYDVILMDQRMPEMDGTEAMRHIRENSKALNADTPFICLTADAVSGARERYLAEGFTDYLTKPIDYKALEKMLVKYLPADKVRVVKKQKKEDASRTDRTAGISVPGDFNALRDAGIDTQVGFAFCQNDADLYRSVLEEYERSSGDKAKNLQDHYDTQNWKKYEVLVHSVKSTSKTIGAASLAEEAARLETAAKKGETEIIRSGHEAMLVHFRKTAQAIGALFPRTETPENTAHVFEFSPSGKES